MTAAMWVCGNCRSVNRAADGRCYSCHVPRALALDPEASEGPARKLAEDTPPEQKARVARELGAGAGDTSRLALLAQVAVLVVTAVTLARAVLAIRFFLGFEAAIQDPASAVDEITGLGIVLYLSMGGWFLGLVAWGAWLGRVVANIPALGGGWPHATPRSAFLTTLIPGGNLYWTTSVMREAMTSLSPAGSPRLGLIAAWWLTVTPAAILLLGIGPVRFVRTIAEGVVAVFLAAAGDANPIVTTVVLFEIVGAFLLVAGAWLAILLVQHFERLQAERRAALGT